MSSKQFGLILLLLVLLPVVSAYKPTDFFTELIENKADLTEGYSIFKSCNPVSTDIVISSKMLKSRYVNYAGSSITKIDFFILSNVTTSSAITDYRQSCSNYTSPGNKTKINNCIMIKNGSHVENTTTEQFIPMSFPYTLKKGNCAIIKIVGHWKPRTGLVSNEWFVGLNVSNVMYERLDWAWWNTSYQHRKLVTLSNATSETMHNPIIRVYEYRYGSYSWYDGVNVTGLSFSGTNATNEIAVTLDNDTAIDFQVLDYGPTWAVILPMIGNRTGSNSIGLYVYYNLATPSISSRHKVIRLYGYEANGTTLDSNWICQGTGCANVVSNGILNVTATTPGAMYSNQQQLEYAILEWRMRQTTTDPAGGIYIEYRRQADNDWIGWNLHSSVGAFCTSNVVDGDTSCIASDSNYHVFRLNLSASRATWYIDYAVENDVATASTFNGKNNISYIEGQGSKYGYIDWLRAYQNSTILGYDINFYSTPFAAAIDSEETQTISVPVFSNNRTSHTNPEYYYPVRNFGYQITAVSNLTAVNFVSNITGSNRSYNTTTAPAVVNASNVYWINFTNIPARTFNYYWSATNSTGTNATQTIPYTVLKLGQNYLGFNCVGTGGTYPGQISQDCYITNVPEGMGGDADVTYTLYRNTSVAANNTGLTNGYAGRNLLDTSNVPAGVYTYNYSAAGGQNWTAFNYTETLTMNKGTPTGLAITFLPSSSVTYGTQTTASCSFTEGGSVSLVKDSVVVGNPHVATLAVGSHSYNCSITDVNYTSSSVLSVLTVTAFSSGCTNNDTYAFYATVSSGKTITLVDMTDFISLSLVKSDLSDVYVNLSTAVIQKNVSGGRTYAVVNASAFTLLFSNYYIDYDYSNYNGNITNITNISTYTEITPYYKLVYYDELTKTQQLPPSANISLTIFCSEGTTIISNVSSSYIVIPTVVRPDRFRTVVSYSPTSYYYRDLLVRSDSEVKSVYLVDALQNSVDQIKVTLIDTVGTFGGSTFQAKKYISSTLQTITELPFDSDSKVIAYLIDGDQYQIYVDNGVEVRSVGNFYTDSSSLEKNLYIAPLTGTWNATYGNVSYSLVKVNDVISFTYYDDGADTLNVTMYTYYENNTLVNVMSSTNHSTINFILDTTPYGLNETYKVYIHIAHPLYGSNSLDFWTVFGSIASTIAIQLPRYLPVILPELFPAAGIILLLGVPMLFGRMNSPMGGIITVLVAALLAYWNWIYLSGAVIILAGVLALIHKIREGEKR